MIGLLAGCRSELNPAYCAAHPTDDRCANAVFDGPAASDGTTDGNEQPAVCVGEGKFKVCLRELPAPNMISTQIGTASATCLDQQPIGWIEQGQPESCFIVGSTLQLTGTLAIKGARPLVLVATDTITLTGVLDLSARKGRMFNPPGFSVGGCDPFAATATDKNTGGSGGAGGSLGAFGGNGGAGDNGGVAPGKAAGPANEITVLHAGCVGEAGGAGDGQGSNVPSAGGFGGGAIALIAGNKIVFSGTAQINASGAAGTAGGHRTGGGGGGSGGMIALWAPMYDVGTGTLVFANGGGGASGGTNSNDGTDGIDPPSNPANPLIPANGGTLAGAGAGGNGYALNIDPQAGGTGNSGDGGGGGGGGAGIIFANQALGSNATVSPAPTLF
ncbi:MAG: hypothetical protein QM831_20025 [Kofleriaceae bacterium]